MNVFVFLILIKYAATCTEENVQDEIVPKESSAFLDAVHSAAFVDKSMMLKNIFSADKLLITAPRGFGKSTNLDMIHKFLTIDSYSNMRLRETFENLEIYKNAKDLFNMNFGMHPVIYINLEATYKLKTFDDLVAQMRVNVHKSFLMHKYIWRCERTHWKYKRFFRVWINSYDAFTLRRVLDGLPGLVRIVSEHFRRNVTILIDEYDSLINRAIMDTSSSMVLNNAIETVTHIIRRTSNLEKYVNRTIVMGTSFISSLGLYTVTNMKRFRFLEEHCFNSFFGLTESEMNHLFTKTFSLSEDKIHGFVENDYGYVCRSGLKLYNTFSVVKFLMNIESPIIVSDYDQSLANLFAYPVIEDRLEALIKGFSVNIDFYFRIEQTDVELLNKMYTNLLLNKDDANVNLLLSQFIELGYLTYFEVPRMREDVIQVRIPNKTITNCLISGYKRHYMKKHALNHHLVGDTNYKEFKELVDKYKNQSKILLMCKTAGCILLKMMSPLWSLIQKFIPFTSNGDK